MAVAFDAIGHLDTGVTTTATTLSGAPITVGSGSNRAIAVFLSFGQSNALPTGITVTCGGTSMTAITNASVLGASGVLVTGIWFGLVNPTSGTPTITANWTGGRACIMGAISVTGVNQTGGATSFAHGTSVSNATLTATPSITITSAVGNMTAAFFIDDGGTVFASTSATQDFIDNPGGGVSAAMNHTAGAASNTMTASYTGTDATTCAGFDFVAAAGGVTDLRNFFVAPWQNPVRRRDLPTSECPFLAFTALAKEDTTRFEWTIIWTEPVRIKPGLAANRQQFLAFTPPQIIVPATGTGNMLWHSPWSAVFRRILLMAEG